MKKGNLVSLYPEKVVPKSEAKEALELLKELDARLVSEDKYSIWYLYKKTYYVVPKVGV
jgi:hypothetical protein